MERPWAVICGDLDRATGRRFPPVVGPGRGYVMGRTSDLTEAELVEMIRVESSRVAARFLFKGAA
jgi:hypothetical protein